MARKLADAQQAHARKLSEAEKAVRAAKKALKDAEAAKDAAEAEGRLLRQQMETVTRDEQSDVARVMEVVSRNSNLSYGSERTVTAAFADLITLQGSADILSSIDAAARTLAASPAPAATKAAVIKVLHASPYADSLVSAIGTVLGSLKPSTYGLTSLSSNVWLDVISAACVVAPTAAAIAEPLAEALVHASRQTAPNGLGASVQTCQLTNLLRPALGMMRRVPSMAGAAASLESSVRAALEASVAKPLPTADDFAMPQEAALVGGANSALRDFLLSPTQTAATFNTSKAGRMAIHRLIDYTPGLAHKLSHQSEGYGHARALVVRKKAVTTATDVSRMKDLQALHREILAELGDRKPPPTMVD